MLLAHWPVNPAVLQLMSHLSCAMGYVEHYNYDNIIENCDDTVSQAYCEHHLFVCMPTD